MTKSTEAIKGAPIANLGLWEYREKNWDYGITPCLKYSLSGSLYKIQILSTKIQPFSVIYKIKFLGVQGPTFARQFIGSGAKYKKKKFAFAVYDLQGCLLAAELNLAHDLRICKAVHWQRS